jgi:hypothetical protein
LNITILLLDNIVVSFPVAGGFCRLLESFGEMKEVVLNMEVGGF